jgi:SWI/SNF-related matrix-associated actin-dependent regulator of chromatin subfamily A member 5
MRAVRLHSSDAKERERLRRELLKDLKSVDCVVTTYEMATSSAFSSALLARIHWRYLVLDEGHKVKNDGTLVHQALSRVHRQSTLLLTGTPVQNNLHELFALLSFLYPHVFTLSAAFDR